MLLILRFRQFKLELLYHTLIRRISLLHTHTHMHAYSIFFESEVEVSLQKSTEISVFITPMHYFLLTEKK